jgi:hypothetical protein
MPMKTAVIPVFLLAWLTHCPCFAAPLAASAISRSEPLPNLHASLEAVFQKESTAVLFRFQPAKPSSNASFIVEQIDETGAPIRRLGLVHDDGAVGDVQARDGIYGGKFQLNEKKPGTLRLQAFDESTYPLLPVSAPVSIEVVRHPAFQELLSQIWKRLKGLQNLGFWRTR